MNKYWFVVLFLVCSFCLQAQVNLVPNPSFEDTVACPQYIGQIDYAIGWTSYRESPDYFNSCHAGALGVPANARGFQQAATGIAYAGFSNYACCLNLREYIGNQLTSKLIIGQKYFVSFKVSLCDFSPFNCAINNIGARFFMKAYSDTNPAPIDNFSHIHVATIITDSVNWTLVSGSFVADSSYQFICLGNFYDDNNTDTLQCVQYANYFIDDVCVSTDSLQCSGTISLIENNEVSIGVFPNPFQNYITIHSNDICKYIYKIYSIDGVQIVDGECDKNKSIETSIMESGVYVLKITCNNKTKIIKVIKIN